MLAADRGHTDVVEVLLTNGADPNIAMVCSLSSSSVTPPQLYTRAVQVWRDCNNCGCSTGPRGHHCSSCKAWRRFERCNGAMPRLVPQASLTASPQAKDGRTALMVACKSGAMASVRELLKAQAAVNQFAVSLKRLSPPLAARCNTFAAE